MMVEWHQQLNEHEFEQTWDYVPVVNVVNVQLFVAVVVKSLSYV